MAERTLRQVFEQYRAYLANIEETAEALFGQYDEADLNSALQTEYWPIVLSNISDLTGGKISTKSNALQDSFVLSVLREQVPDGGPMCRKENPQKKTRRAGGL